MAIALYGADQRPSDRADLRHRRPAPSINRWARRTAATNCVRKSPEPAAALLGSARTTTRSATSSSAHDAPTTCRNLRVTRCRSTAPPTALVTTKPTLGPPPPNSRRRWTTRSGWADRTPRWIVRPKSADRVSRFRAGSTSTYDPRVRQSARDDPCAAAPRRWPCPPGSASANGSHGPWPGGGCSAGKSACPWPRLHLLVMSGGTGKPPRPPRPLLSPTRTGAVPSYGRCRVAYGGDALRVLRSTPQVKPPQSGNRCRCAQLPSLSWRQRRNLLASATAPAGRTLCR